MKHNSRIVPGCLAMVVNSRLGNEGKVVTVISRYTALTPYDNGAGNYGAPACECSADGWMCEGDLFSMRSANRKIYKVLRRPMPGYALMRLDDPDNVKDTEKKKEKEHG